MSAIPFLGASLLQYRHRMTLASRVRAAFDDWSTTHTGYLIDSAIASYYSPRDSREDVIVVLGLDGLAQRPPVRGQGAP